MFNARRIPCPVYCQNDAEMTYRNAQRPILYICPRTGRTVQGLLAEDASDPDEPNKDRYEPISCIACSETHFVNRKTGAVLGAGAKSR
jgi:hypothetical protein